MDILSGQDFVKDPDNEGSVLGWGVFRMAPWHLARLFDSEDAARSYCLSLGGDYRVAYGSHRLGTDDFVA